MNEDDLIFMPDANIKITIPKVRLPSVVTRHIARKTKQQNYGKDIDLIASFITKNYEIILEKFEVLTPVAVCDAHSGEYYFTFCEPESHIDNMIVLSPREINIVKDNYKHNYAIDHLHAAESVYNGTTRVYVETVEKEIIEKD